MTNQRTIVVGFDGSEEAKRAVQWAAKYAVVRECSLHVVHCSLWVLLSNNRGPVPGVADSGLERAAQKVLEEGLALAQETVPDLEVRTTLLHGTPRDHLARVSLGAEMLVLGSRGLGGFMGLLVGSVSLEMAATAECPVAVIRADDHPEGPVLLAVDDSGSPAALDDACRFAAATGADLMIVHVLHEPAGYRLLREPVEAYPDAEALLDSVLSQARHKAPGVTVAGELLFDASFSKAVVKASQGARITVVGTKGHGVIKGTIGSTAHAVLHHAHSPVLVSRRRVTTEVA
ncbi:Nucleotide-binding universal stress protein, UspA family [Arthrobacter sp. yr096]|uniref:universal stress protein n=1 Tax=Arthrobacter sp. yr096 TaxID=1761750 RepID=UPI0008C22CA9|nr:universal stress protein [Arthrobacter sp. yr096]SEJ80577.1 Nucleotide-binding universal stress protein, UspA family [Arthrobacter sp. yr096]